MTSAIRPQPMWSTPDYSAPQASLSRILAKCISFWLTGFAILAVCFV